MNLNPTSKAFYIKLYHWLIHEICDEILNDFPILSHINSIPVLEVIEVMKAATHQEKIQFAITSVRKAYQELHNDILDEVGDPWNKNDEKIWTKFQRDKDAVSKFQWLKQNQDLKTSFSSQIDLFIKFLLEKLDFSENVSLGSSKGYSFIYNFEFKNWFIDLNINLKPPSSSIPFDYYYVIRGFNGWSLTPAHFKFDILNYWRIYSAWDLLTWQSLPQSANAIAVLSSKFVNAVPILLENISPPETSEFEARIYQIRYVTQNLKENFNRHFFAWSLDDAKREVEESFPFIKRINSNSATEALVAMYNLDFHKQIKAAEALVKYSNWNYLSSDERLNEEEMRILLYNYYDSDATNNLIENREINIETLKLSRKEAISLIKNKIKPIAGSIIQSYRGEWVHQKNIHDWRIKTSIILTDNELSYTHYVSDAETGSLTLVSTDILTWLGIDRETCWYINNNLDVIEASETLFDVCKHFLDALHIILDGLDADKFIEWPC